MRFSVRFAMGNCNSLILSQIFGLLLSHIRAAPPLLVEEGVGGGGPRRFAPLLIQEGVGDGGSRAVRPLRGYHCMPSTCHPSPQETKGGPLDRLPYSPRWKRITLYIECQERLATARVACRGLFQGRDITNPRHKKHGVATISAALSP